MVRGEPGHWLPCVIAAAFACRPGARMGSDAGTQCLESLDEYCARAVPPCARLVDPGDPGGSLCDQILLMGYSQASVDVVTCGDGPVLLTVDWVGNGSAGLRKSFVYDRDMGDLLAVREIVTENGVAAFGACIGGPSVLPASGTCIDLLFGPTCGAPDAPSE
jgi:hypothetical protein